jgi:hypothetical protein
MNGERPVPPLTNPSTAAFGRIHLHFGWWSLLVFPSLGAVLEALHGFKASFYLATGDQETRRLLWPLAHAHGTLLALVHIVFGLPLPALETMTARARTVASRCLFAASILLPGGFFLGGLVLYGGDPGLGILLVPAAVVPLWMGVFLAARGAAPPPASDAERSSR